MVKKKKKTKRKTLARLKKMELSGKI